MGPIGPQGPYTPDYDSGWVNISDKAGEYFNVTHSLNSTDVIVDIGLESRRLCSIRSGVEESTLPIDHGYDRGYWT